MCYLLWFPWLIVAAHQFQVLESSPLKCYGRYKIGLTFIEYPFHSWRPICLNRNHNPVLLLSKCDLLNQTYWVLHVERAAYISRDRPRFLIGFVYSFHSFQCCFVYTVVRRLVLFCFGFVSLISTNEFECTCGIFHFTLRKQIRDKINKLLTMNDKEIYQILLYSNTVIFVWNSH